MAGDCIAAYGHDYQITWVEATGIPETAWSGGSWDLAGGLPDPYLHFVVINAETLHWYTNYRENTLHPVWNEHTSEAVRINESTRVRFELWDADTLYVDDDPIIGNFTDEESYQIPISWIRAGGWTSGGGGIEVVIEIVPL